MSLPPAKTRISMSPYRCPECLGDLSPSRTHLRCDSCNASYSVADGLPLLCRQRDFYYGEVTKDVMQQILSRSVSIGWHDALVEHADAVNGRDFYDYATHALRSGFKFLLDRFETGTVLDYGCGLGGIATSLAHSFATVYATDLTFERVQFTRIRAAQEKLRNVTAFCSGDTPHIPLADQSVDVIILNGVLEWITDFRSGEPRSLQIEFLREMARVLKDSGLLFIGIENRTAYGYFLGRKEEHTRLRFVSLLPRSVANIYSQRARGRPFRTYTYTRSGYGSLLASAGLHCTQFFGMLPDYRITEQVFRIPDKRMVRECLIGQTGFKRVRNILARPFFPAVVGSFGILSGKQPVTPYFQRLLQHVEGKHLGGEPLEALSYKIRPTGAVHVTALNRNGSYIVKLPLSPSAELRMEAGVRNVQQMQRCLGQLMNALPLSLPIAWDRYQGQAFLIAMSSAGWSMDKLMVKTGLGTFLPLTCDFLATLCRYTQRQGEAWSQILKSAILKYGRSLADECRRRGLSEILIDDKINKIADYAATRASDTKGFRCISHGDFWHGNIVLAPKPWRITAILDWDRLEEESLPLLDLFNLLTAGSRLFDIDAQKHPQWFERNDWGQSIVKLHDALIRESADTEVLRVHASKLGIEKRLIPLFLLVYWVRQCLYLLRDDMLQLKPVLNNMIWPPLQYFSGLATKTTEHIEAATPQANSP
jgi:ubiquinone/menaquinone biosynthesis C-methylase UbiE